MSIDSTQLGAFLIALLALVGSGVVGALMSYPGVAPLLVGLAAVYMLYLAWRIATAPALSERTLDGPAPGFVPGLLLALFNPKGYAVFATLFSGFEVIPGDLPADALFKGLLLLALLTLIDGSWLFAGSALRRLFHEPVTARRINIAFAVLLLASVAMAVAV